MMYEYRITKYNPQYRDSQGRYLRDEWTSYAEVGSSVSSEAYAVVESAYLDTALSFMGECGIPALDVVGLESSRQDALPCSLAEGTRLPGAALRGVLQGLLRERYWCRLESTAWAYIPVGRDYYMYVGVPCEGHGSIEHACATGLFVEPFVSPYKG